MNETEMAKLENELREKLRPVAEERASNYVQMYLPGWALENWTEGATGFLEEYLLDMLVDAVVADIAERQKRQPT